MDAKRKALGLVSRANGGVDNTWCSASYDNMMPCGAPIDKRNKGQAYQDNLGYWWCPEHRNRGWLLDWGVAHSYPLIRFRGEDGAHYAIGGDKKDPELWKAAILMGNEKAIEAAVKYVQSHLNQEAM